MKFYTILELVIPTSVNLIIKILPGLYERHNNRNKLLYTDDLYTSQKKIDNS